MHWDGKSEYWSEKYKNLNFVGLEIASKEFNGCTFEKCNFSEATFKKCRFVDCDFISCNLSIVKMQYSTFTDVSFRNSKLIGINWTTAAWSELIYSSPIKFYNSILNDCSFYGLSLHDLVLEECKAHNVDFREGDFSHSNFTNTELSGASFVNTNLTGVDFSGAIDYDIDIYQNTIKKGKFSRFEAVRLLNSLEIALVD